MIPFHSTNSRPLRSVRALEPFLNPAKDQGLYANDSGYLLLSQESLGLINERLEGRAAVDERNFRPNILVKGE